MIGTVVIGLSILTLLAPAPGSGADPGILAAQAITDRILLGLNQSKLAPGAMLFQQAEESAKGTARDKLGLVVLASEMVSPEAAIQRLEQLNEDIDSGVIEAPESLQPVIETVGALLFASAAGESHPALEEKAQVELEWKLGIAGTLLEARATNDPEQLALIEGALRRAWIAVLVIGAWFLFAGIGGIVVLSFLAILTVMGKLRSSLELSEPGGSVYVETFAIWLFGFFGLQILVDMIVGAGDGLENTSLLFVKMLAMFASLVALVWPIVRGISFNRMMDDVGLRSTRPVADCLAGVAVYMAGLPILLVGVVISIGLSKIFLSVTGEAPEPSHPIQDALGSGMFALVCVYMVATVAAPIVEEIMFRGVLFRYLRSVSGPLGWVMSFAIAALTSSFIFAAIHPQGIVFIPVLGALGVAFCIGREWRGSILTPIVAHALNNGIVITLNVVLLS